MSNNTITPPRRLTDKDRFWILLDRYPALSQFWDRDDESVDLDRLASAPLSSGEAIIADVLASIWLGNGAKHKIDFTDLATLDRSARQPLIDWINDPCWP